MTRHDPFRLPLRGEIQSNPRRLHLRAVVLMLIITGASPALAQDSAASGAADPHGTPPVLAVAQSVGDASTSTPRTLATVVTDAVREYRATGVARVVTAGGVTAFPYAHARAVLACPVLRACVVELERGERLVHPPVAGDNARWIIDQASAGGDDGSAFVLLKPKACGITTNLVLLTDRRIYDVLLDSPRCTGDARRPSRSSTSVDSSVNAERVHRVTFYYPDEPGSDLAALVDTARGASREIGTGPEVSSTEPEPPINRDYRVVRRRKFLFWHAPMRFPWRPANVYDDGAHTYLVLPLEARHHPAPVLYALEDDGSRSLVNTTLVGDTLVTDRTFRRAALVIMAGGTEQRLVLENRAWGRTPHEPSVPADTGRVP